MIALADGNVLKLNADGRSCEVEFNDRVAQVLDASPLVIVRTEPAPGTIDNRNVYGVAQDGALRWRIEEAISVYDDSPYVNVARKADGFHAYDWGGKDTLFDPMTGKILAVRQGK